MQPCYVSMSFRLSFAVPRFYADFHVSARPSRPSRGGADIKCRAGENGSANQRQLPSKEDLSAVVQPPYTGRAVEAE
jgi:hypothetical protein